MSIPPIPVVFEPIFKPKPWGGRELARLFDKPLPHDVPIGESWELADLPGSESRVAVGPLAGKRAGELIEMWGRDLLGCAEPAAGRFPLLIKFLDARQPLSLQVHPRGASVFKHEAWYVINADPGAALYLGLKPGVGPDDIRAAGSTAAIADLHQLRPAGAGDCYYLPSGIPHALGAGFVVAEVQTPSDVTYRLYDWDRVDLDGRPRELHVDQALANIRYGVSERQIVPPRSHVAHALAADAMRLIACERFEITQFHCRAGIAGSLPGSGMAIWIVVSGDGWLTRDRYRCDFKCGDVVLVPAESSGTRFEAAADCEVLEVTIPGARG